MNIQYQGRPLPEGLVLNPGDEVLDQIDAFTIVWREAQRCGEVVVDHSAFASRQERRAAERAFLKASRYASQGLSLNLASSRGRHV
jgi:hypothetical protein